MNEFLQFFILFPFLGFIISLFLPEAKEKTISWTAFGTVFLQLIGITAFIIWWLFEGAPDLNLVELSVLKTAHYEFFIDFYFDKVSAVYLFIGALLT
ncbi:hypothetical protein [Flavobacterium filum]|nr:hypothetical protein [Flavobacterium filum]